MFPEVTLCTLLDIWRESEVPTGLFQAGNRKTVYMHLVLVSVILNEQHFEMASWRDPLKNKVAVRGLDIT